MESTALITESQVDWLTGAVHTQEGQGWLRHKALELKTPKLESEYESRRFRLMGYEGWSCGPIRYGERGSAGLLQLSGNTAEQEFAAIYPFLDNVSRLDVAVTARHSPADPTLGELHYNEAIAYRDVNPKSARPEAHQNGDGGYTCYIGGRASDWFCRIYNKQAEREDAKDEAGAEHYKGAWRYELELKGLAGKQVAETLYNVDQRAAAVQALVYGYCASHGVAPLWPPVGQLRLEPGFTRRTDRLSRERWLRETVRPTVHWLIAQAGVEAVLGLLGLPTDMGDPK